MQTLNACIGDYDTRLANTQRDNTHVRNWHRHGSATLTRDMGRHASLCVMFIANVPVDAFALRIRYGDLYVRHHRSPRLTWRAAMLRHCARNLLTVPRCKHIFAYKSKRVFDGSDCPFVDECVVTMSIITARKYARHTLRASPTQRRVIDSGMCEINARVMRRAH